MSGKSYRVFSRSSIDRDKRVRYLLWLRISLAVNAIVVLLWILSRRANPETPPVDLAWQGALKDSAQNISQLNKDLKATAAVLQTVKNRLEAETHTAVSHASDLANAIADSHIETAADDTSPSLAWLAIGIPTVPRHNDTDYLTSTLEYLLSELPLDSTDPLFDKVRVVVMNNSPGQHLVYAKVQNRMTQGPHDPDDVFAQKAALYVEFVDNPGSVRRQTCDLIELMEMAQPIAHYYLFMEDDFRMCPHTMRLLPYMLAKLNAMPSAQKWLGLRVSYGMNGILLRSEDLKSFATYMRTRIELLPPDLIWLEWFSGHGPRTMANRRRPMAAYRYNLLEHIGAVSSFTVRVERPAFPNCYESMADVWSLARAERFQYNTRLLVFFLARRQITQAPVTMDTREFLKARR
ncbi:MAG: hypothetical protein FRX49_00828, partial [Trebouxia sp. A1-2]